MFFINQLNKNHRHYLPFAKYRNFVIAFLTLVDILV